jgi:histidinol-phosphate phosphatase family protein
MSQSLQASSIHQDWTLFLDRDGVINFEKNNDYILHRAEFKFYDGVKAALAYLATRFDRIVIATNQKGVAKGLMTQHDLNDIHAYMLEEIQGAGGRIDRIYACTDMSDDSPNRKPQAGMAFMAQQEIPGIDLSKSIMVGNRMSDMKFGRNAGMYTVFLATTHPETAFPDPAIDLRFDDLAAFAAFLKDS